MAADIAFRKSQYLSPFQVGLTRGKIEGRSYAWMHLLTLSDFSPLQHNTAF